MMKKIAYISVVLFTLFEIVHAQALSHPRDQIALQLGAIQMGYPVPFALVNGNTVNAQQAANALAMGRNALDATLSKPTSKVQGVVNSPAVDSIEFRDQLYKAVEAVVTSPVIGTIKGNALMEGGKTVKVTGSLKLPPNSHTIPIPFAVEAAHSLDAQQLAKDLTNLTEQVTSQGANLSKTDGAVSALAGNLNTTNSSIGSLSAKVTSVQNNANSASKQIDTLGYMKNALVSQGVILDYAPCFVNGLQKFTGFDNPVDEKGNFVGLTGLELDGKGGIYVSANYIYGDYNYYGLILNISSSGDITTIAGGSPDRPIDGTSNSAQFTKPDVLITDSNGNVYLEDGGSIRKVAPSGQVTTLAGSWSYGVEDGTGSAAKFGNVSVMAVDREGNVYVADNSDWGKLRKVTPTGVVTTMYESIYDSIDNMVIDGNGNLYFEDDNKIRKLTPGGLLTTLAGGGSPNEQSYIDGAGNSARFYSINCLSIDSLGNLFVSDQYRIRKVTPSGVVTTVAGSGESSSIDGIGAQASFSDISSIVIDSDGKLYIADYNKIRKVTPSGVVTTLAGSGEENFTDGNGSAASFHWIRGMVKSAGDHLYLLDYNYIEGVSKIRKVTLAGLVSTVEGSEDYGYRRNLAFDGSGNLIVTQNDDDNGDTLNSKVWKIAPSNSISTIGNSVSSSSVDGSGSDARFGPIGQTLKDNVGNLYVIDYDNSSDNYRIRKVTPTGVVSTLAGGGPTDQGYVDGTGPQASFGNINCMVTDSAGNIYFTDSFSEYNRIRKVTPAGVVSTLAGGGSTEQGYIYGLKQGYVYGLTIPQIKPPTGVNRTVEGNGTVEGNAGGLTIPQIKPPTGGEPTEEGYVDGPSLQASFNFIKCMVVDKEGNIFVTDKNVNVGDRIRKVTPAGIVSTLAGGEPTDEGNIDGPGLQASFADINCMVIDKEGNLYVAETTEDDYDGDRIRKVTPSGHVTTLAGGGRNYRPDDGVQVADGLGENASFGRIARLAFDSNGSLFAFEESRVRKLTTDNRVQTLVGDQYYNEEGYDSDLSGNSLPINVPGFEYEIQNAFHIELPNLLKVDENGNIYMVDGMYSYSAWSSMILKLTTQ